MLVVHAKYTAQFHAIAAWNVKNEWAWQLVGAVNENAISRNQCMRKNRQSSTRLSSSW